MLLHHNPLLFRGRILEAYMEMERCNSMRICISIFVLQTDGLLTRLIWDRISLCEETVLLLSAPVP